MTNDGVTIEDEPLKWINRRIHDEYGIFVPREKLGQLKSKLKRRLNRLGLDDLQEYAQLLETHPDEEPRLVDVITTNKTYFFRERAHWDFFRDRLIPQWRKSRDLVRIWSCACSSGEEPYSAAMILEDQPGSFPYKILASDLCESILRVGSRGVYAEDALDSVRKYKPEYVEKFFSRKGDQFRVADRIRDKIHFRRFNLQFHSNPFKNRFDLILLRNVLIYFNESVIRRVVDRCFSLLRPKGYLFVGHTEVLNSMCHSFEKVRPAVYRRVETIRK